MTIIEKIRNSIQAVHGDDFGVYYHDEVTLDVMAEKMTFPCAIVQLLTHGNVVLVNGQVREVVSAAIFFVDKSEFDFDADDNEEIIDECKRRAFAWLLALPMDEWLSLENVERTQRAYERFDAILTGFGMLCRLVELEGVTDCEQPGDDENENNDNDNEL